MQWIPEGKTFKTEDEKNNYLTKKIDKFLKENLPDYLNLIFKPYKLIIETEYMTFAIYRNKIKFKNITIKNNKDWQSFFQLSNEYKKFFAEIDKIYQQILLQMKKTYYPPDAYRLKKFFERYAGDAAGMGDDPYCKKTYFPEIWDTDWPRKYEAMGFQMGKKGEILYGRYYFTPAIADTLNKITTALRFPTEEEEIYDTYFDN